MPIKIRVKDWCLGLLIIALAAVFYYWSYEQITDVGTSMEGVRSPRFFPRFTLILACFLSIIIIIKDLTAKDLKGAEKVTIFSAQMLVLIALAWGFVLTIGTLGYFVSAPTIMIILMIYLGEKSWKKILILSIGFPIILYFFFDHFLEILFPMGKILGPFLDR